MFCQWGLIVQRCKMWTPGRRLSAVTDVIKIKKNKQKKRNSAQKVNWWKAAERESVSEFSVGNFQTADLFIFNSSSFFNTKDL